MTAAYWLAYTYHVSPETFLACTVDELYDHVDRTGRMLKQLNRK